MINGPAFRSLIRLSGAPDQSCLSMAVDSPFSAPAYRSCLFQCSDFFPSVRFGADGMMPRIAPCLQLDEQVTDFLPFTGAVPSENCREYIGLLMKRSSSFPKTTLNAHGLLPLERTSDRSPAHPDHRMQPNGSECLSQRVKVLLRKLALNCRLNPPFGCFSFARMKDGPVISSIHADEKAPTDLGSNAGRTMPRLAPCLQLDEQVTRPSPFIGVVPSENCREYIGLLMKRTLPFLHKALFWSALMPRCLSSYLLGIRSERRVQRNGQRTLVYRGKQAVLEFARRCRLNPPMRRASFATCTLRTAQEQGSRKISGYHFTRPLCTEVPLRWLIATPRSSFLRGGYFGFFATAMPDHR